MLGRVVPILDQARSTTHTEGLGVHQEICPITVASRIRRCELPFFHQAGCSPKNQIAVAKRKVSSGAE
jgi:hypothetical protein